MCMARLSLSLSLTHTHTHMASGAWGHYFWCDVQQLEHAGVLYSSTGTAADQRKACVCVLQFMICTVRRLWIYYLIIIFQYFHLFNLHNILLLHFQRFSYVCVCGVLQMGIIVFEWERYSVQTVWPIWIWIKLWNSRNESGQGRKKRGKGRRRGVRGWLVWSQDGARRERERGQTANQL